MHVDSCFNFLLICFIFTFICSAVLLSILTGAVEIPFVVVSILRLVDGDVQFISLFSCFCIFFILAFHSPGLLCWILIGLNV